MKKGRLFYQVIPLLFALILISGCKQKKPETVKIVFSSGPENAGTLKTLVEEFNKANQGQIEVQFKEGSRLSNELFDQLATDFSSENYNVDVWASDVVWTQAMASKGWAEDLTHRFFKVYNADQFEDATINSVTYQSKIWAMPWYIDVGVLYFRKDLLAEQKIASPPTLWSEIIPLTKKIMKVHPEVPYGYLFQTDAYEGGTVNACEFIWNAGGSMMLGDFSIESNSQSEPNIVTINSKEGIKGLQQARSVFENKLSASDAQNFRELECANLFFEGKSVFMRGWPTALAQFKDSKFPVKLENIGMSPLPVSSAGIESKSCLGGWNLMINAHSSEKQKEAAWNFILYLVSPESQKYRAQKEATLPSLKSLYSDADLIQKAPIVGPSRALIQNSKNRPNSPYYMEMTPFISTAFHKVIKGELKADSAAVYLANRLEEIINLNAKL